MSDLESSISKSREGRKTEPISLFSAHGRVLLGISRTPEDDNSQLAQRLGLSQSQVRQSVAFLARTEALSVTRKGRRRTCLLNRDAVLPIHGIGSIRLGVLLSAVVQEQ